jgi:chromosome segregation and condensation protein ScpB
MICASLNRPVFIKNLLRYLAEKILLLNTTNLRGDYRDIFGKDTSRDIIARLVPQGLIGRGPRSPRPGGALTYVTTDQFLVVFGLKSLRELDDEALQDSGLVMTRK